MEKEIDLILIECRDDQLARTNFGISDIRRKAIQKANILRLIQPRNAHSYELTEKGLEALKHGGISQYDDFIKIKESKDDKDNFIYDQLLAYDLPKASITRLRKRCN